MNEEIITKNVNSAANKIVSIIFGVLSSYALLIYNNKVFINRGALGNELTNELGDILPNLAFPVFSLFLAFCYSKTFKKIHFSLSACILSFLFSVFTITGLSFSVYSDERLWGKYFLPNNASNFFGRFTLLAVIGFGLIYYVILANLFNYFDNYTSVVIKDRITSKGPLSTVRNFIDKHPFACAAIVIAICWIPYFVIFYPGAFMTDGYRQLNEFYGYIGKTTHHPYLATTIMGLIFSIGKPFGLNAAMFIYTTIQGILGCLAFAYTISQAYRLVRDSKFSRMALLVFGIATANFALFPIYPMSMGIIYKDNPYIISTLIFFTIIVVACVNKKVNLKTFFLFLISGIGVLAFRNDGILIFIVGSVCLLFLLATGKKKIIVSSIVMTLTLLLLNSIVFPNIGVKKFTNAEMMSVPLQQTARFLRDHPNDVTADEQETLQSLLKSGYTTDDLAQKYNPLNSDNVKNKFKSFTSDSFKQYLSVWAAMLTKHPSTYLEATIGGTYKYYYPFETALQVPIYYISNAHEVPNYWEMIDRERFDNKAGLGHIEYPNALKPAASTITKVVLRSYSVPVLTMFYNSGIYAWALMITITMVLRKRQWKKLIPFIPIVCIYLICLISPVNGSMRYSLPWLVTLPVLVGLVLKDYSSAHDPVSDENTQE